MASNVGFVAADLEQDEEGSADEDSECENSPDPGDVMDFSAAAIAEQLTQIDSVREEAFLISLFKQILMVTNR